MINHYLGMAERIKVNLKTKPKGRRRRRSIEDAVLEPPTSPEESECEVTETERRVVRRVADDEDRDGGSANWFLDLLAEVEGTPMEWTDRSKKADTRVQPPLVARQNFSRLRKFYDNMLGRSNPDEISAADLVNCWFIAGVDMDRLRAIYDGSISAGRQGFFSRLESVLGPYESGIQFNSI